jgi:hypothetical protein
MDLAPCCCGSGNHTSGDPDLHGQALGSGRIEARHFAPAIEAFDVPIYFLIFSPTDLTGQTHKHKWTDLCGDRFAYTPSDITAQDIQGQLAQFCSECDIDYAATIAAFPLLQGGFFDEL